MALLIDQIGLRKWRKGFCIALFGVLAVSPSRAQFTEYPLPTAGSQPYHITEGPDGALWFTEFHGAAGFIGRITTLGSISEYPLPAGSGGTSITSGPDGALWFIEANSIGRITTSGSVTEFPLPNASSMPQEITAGPDGALWFTEFGMALNFSVTTTVGRIGRITTDGAITEFSVPTANSYPSGIVTGSDGALWFTEYGASKIGRITTSGMINEYTLPPTGLLSYPTASPSSIASGSDGALWFTSTDGIGRITTSGSLTNPSGSGDVSVEMITAGPDGDLWVVVVGSDYVYLYGDTTSGSPGPSSPLIRAVQILGLAAGSDGALWFTENTGKIARYEPLHLNALSPSSAIAGGPAFTLTANGTGFISGASIEWNGSPLATTYVSDTQLTATVPANLIAAVSTATVTVLTGTVASSGIGFPINAVLAINALNPPSMPAGGPSFTLTAMGSGFTTGATINWDGTPLPSTLLDSSDLVAYVPANLIASPGTATITVVLSGGGSAEAKFSVTAPFNSQCANIGGAWSWSESGSLTETISAPVETDTQTNPVSAKAVAVILQNGCSISYNPVGTSGLIGANLTPTQIAMFTRTGTVSGNNVSLTGLLAQVNVVGSAYVGFDVASISSNSVTITGQVSGNAITLNLTGKLVVSGTYLINGQTGPFTETVTATSTAILTRITGPAVTSVGVAYGEAVSAQNTWVIIKGQNLVPSNTPSGGVIWSNAPDFAQGKMPTQLGGVSVTVNGKPAFIYFYCSAVTSSVCVSDQINILTPLDSTVGSASIVVTNNGTSTPAFSVGMPPIAPTFFQFDAAGHIAATHANGSLLAPTALYPGAATPASPGELIIVYANGFGLPTTPLLNGSSSQSGSLLTFPVCQIGAAAAPLAFAGLVSPGLFQFNLTVPTTAQTGDNPLTCTYDGASTPGGLVIPVQR